MLELAIARGLILEHGARAGILIPTHPTRACTRGALGVHAGTIGGDDALDTRARAAKCAASLGARSRIHYGWMRGHTIGTGFACTDTAIVGRYIQIVSRGYGHSCTITRDVLTVARGLSRNWRTRRCIAESALIQTTRARLAERVLARTIGCGQTLHARAAAITQGSAVLIAERPSA